MEDDEWKRLLNKGVDNKLCDNEWDVLFVINESDEKEEDAAIQYVSITSFNEWRFDWF